MKKVSGSIVWDEWNISYVGISDAGLVREINEDDFLIMPEYRLFCVADGMGGHSAGEIASRLTLESLANFMDHLNPDTDTILPLSESPPLFSHYALTASIRYANSVVHQESAGRMMGSTIVTGQFLDGRIYFAHAGDSRIYKLTNGQLLQLTEDHSLVNDLYKQGQISKQEMRTHPQRNIITRAVGSSATIDVTTDSIEVRNKDLLLLCSDGLTGMLDDEEITDILNSANDLTVLGGELVQRANDAGGRDNITVLLVAIS